MITYFRSKNLNAHRITGRIYVIFAVIGSVTGIIVAQRSHGGIPTIISFTILGVLWFTSTLIGFIWVFIFKNMYIHSQCK